MTNYTKYPNHRFYPNSCIICFDDEKYSWCFLSNKQKKYLHDSYYLDNAEYIDVKLPSKKVLHLTIEEFKQWVDNPEDIESDEKKYKALANHNRADQNLVCPKCGSPLVLRNIKKGKRAGSQAYGCSAFPKCRYMRNI